jgi:hypothetical protein
MSRHPLRRAAFAVLGATFAMGLIPSAALAAQSAKGTTTTQAAAHAQEAVAAPHAITPAPACPAQFACATIPSSADSSGGVVQAGPTQNLGDTQWVYINLYQFTPGTSVEIAYCTDTQTLAAGSPLCVSSGYVLSANPAPEYSTQIQADGTQSLSFQVLDIDSSNDPFKGQEPGNANIGGTFFCNATNPCALDVIDSGVDGLGDKNADTDNTAQFPITFAEPFSGCGGSAASVTTESDYGIEFLLPIASAAACSQPNPTLAFNTAQDGLGAVQSLASGAAEVAFTDNPESSQQQGVLNSGNYKLIPVALTANVVGFKAEQQQASVLYPVSNFDLTPTMAAGVLTGVYGTPQAADEVTCSQSLGCPSFGGTVCTRKGATTTCTPQPCPYHPAVQKKGQVGACSLFAELNFAQNFSIAQQNESFVRSDDAGSIGLAFDWLCHAPVVPVNVDIPESSGTPYVASYPDNMTAAQLIQDGFGTPSTPLKSCPNVDQYPPEPVGSTAVYTGYEDPDEQDLKMLSYVGPGLQGGNATAAFASMNWAEAQYYGLQIASLQNGGGAFVTPSPTTLDAAVGDATSNPDGSLALDYSSKDTNAYPMTSVIYAAVCGDAETTNTATDITNMLQQLLNVSGASSSATLPEGFVPLTSGLTQAAESDISHDVVGGASADADQSGCPGAPSSSSSTSSAPSPAAAGSSPTGGSAVGGTRPTVSGGGGSVAGSHFVPGPNGASSQASGKVGFPGLTGAGHPGSGGGGGGGGGVNGYLESLTLSSSSSRVFLPLVLLLGLLALVVGLFMAYSPSVRAQLIGLARGSKRRVGSGVRKTGKSLSSWASRTFGGER